MPDRAPDDVTLVPSEAALLEATSSEATSSEAVGASTVAAIGDDVPRLAVYGTLAPGRQNHRLLAHLPGRWFTGVVRGHLHDAGWGAALGFPGLVLDDAGDAIAVHILESHRLAAEWQRLDEFEGPGYRRVAVVARTPTGPVTVNLYVLADRPPDR